jgi:hypothetical protein
MLVSQRLDVNTPPTDYKGVCVEEEEDEEAEAEAEAVYPEEVNQD